MSGLSANLEKGEYREVFFWLLLLGSWQFLASPGSKNGIIGAFGAVVFLVFAWANMDRLTGLGLDHARWRSAVRANWVYAAVSGTFGGIAVFAIGTASGQNMKLSDDWKLAALQVTLGPLLEEFVFRDSRFTQDGVPKGHPFNDRRFRGAEILVVNQNFGCGSSREHAPQALARWGIRALVGESFAEIFFGNCVALGIPAVSAARADVARLMDAVELDPSQEIALDLAARTLTWRGGSAPIKLPEGAREQLMDGSWDAMRTLLEARDQVLAKAGSLPYAKGF